MADEHSERGSRRLPSTETLEDDDFRLTRHLAADRGLLADVILGFGRRQLLSLPQARKACSEKADGDNRRQVPRSRKLYLASGLSTSMVFASGDDAMDRTHV